MDLTEGLADLAGDADADQVLEAGDVGAEVGVEVVRGEGAPEEGVLGGFEEGGEVGELLDGFAEVGRAAWGLRVVFEGGREGGGGGGEEGEAQAEGWGGEDGERFDEDVGYGFWVGEVGVELVSGGECGGCNG